MKKFIFSLVITSLTLLLSACAGSGSASTNLTVTMTDFHFTPDKFIVPAGKEINVIATNNGAVEHEFVLFKLGTNAGDRFDSQDEINVYWRVKVKPGESKTAILIAPMDIGEYNLVCGIPGHFEAGMSGKIIVVKE